MKRALITGVTGQDGSYLAELLLSKGYEVHGLVRHTSTANTSRIDHLCQPGLDGEPCLSLHYGDVTDGLGLMTLLEDIQPDEIYHLAAQSHVGLSFDQAERTAEVTALGTVRMLEAVRRTGGQARFYQASSSEMFGDAEAPQSETTTPRPRSPYGAAKLYAYSMTRNYREAYGMFATNGVLFNHESPRRGEMFLTRKVTRGIARIVAGVDHELCLGNLDAVRDWGYAPEYVYAMWRLLQASEPGDYVVATGTACSVREFVAMAFEHAGLDWQRYVRHDRRFDRPTEVECLIGDASRITKEFGWQPAIHAPELIRIMVDADLRNIGDGTDGRGRVVWPVESK